MFKIIRTIFFAISSIFFILFVLLLVLIFIFKNEIIDAITNSDIYQAIEEVQQQAAEGD